MTGEPQYPIILRPLPTEDGGGWLALVPDLPGCMSDGSTVTEALENVGRAVLEWQDAAKQMGRPIPRPDASLKQPFEAAVPEHIRLHAEKLAQQMPGGDGEVDPTVLHAILAAWAKEAAERVAA
jgi:antitoxin HicB